MREYVFDGKPHVLSKQLAYAIKKLSPNALLEDHEQVSFARQDLLREYCKYILENDKEKCIQMILEFILQDEDHFERENELMLVYRPQTELGFLQNFSTLGIKFKRVENDNLTEDAS